MATLHKILKAKKRRKDFEKKRNILRNQKKGITVDKKTGKTRRSGPKVQLPKKRKWNPKKSSSKKS